MFVLLFCWLHLISSPTVMAREGKPTINDVLGPTPFTEEHVRMIMRGETVTTRVTPASKNELAIGFACFAEKNAVQEFEKIRRFEWLVPGDRLIGSGTVNSPGMLKDFAGVLFEGKYRDETDRFLKAKTGAELNLSSEEIESFRGIKSTGDREKDSVVVAEGVRRLLLERYRAYRNKGLSGLLPYMRGKHKEVRSGDALQESLKNAIHLKRLFPHIYSALETFPDVSAHDMEEKNYWFGFDVNDRPVYGLAHQISRRSDESGIVVKRVYYLTHSFDVAQIVVTLMPTADGTLFVYGSRIWTEKIKGFGGLFKRAAATSLLTEQMEMVAEQFGACIRKRKE